MRQPSITILLIFFILLGFTPSAFSTLKTGIDYQIPANYSKLSEKELEQKADDYYFKTTLTTDKTLNDDITNALVIYSILQRINPENIHYMVRLGILYDKINKDNLAKSNFSRAISTNPKYAETYFHYGNFYYKRQLYKKALKNYTTAYKLGISKNYIMLLKLSDIYEKFGDTHCAIKYLEEAHKLASNSQIKEKIKQLEIKHTTNKEYYIDPRIRYHEKIND